MDKQQIKINSKIGPLYLVGSTEGLNAVFWNSQNVSMAKNDEVLTVLTEATIQIHEYLAGMRQSFNISLIAEGTPFQKKVWLELSKIPYGETRSYKQIAASIESHKSCRAVGTANGKNPLSIVVPCHRVISSDGSLGGYAGGLAIKQSLLAIERARSPR